MTVRVLHVIQNLNYGGMERLVADLMRRTASHGFDPHVLVLQYAGRFAQGLGAGTVHHGPVLPWWTLAWPGPLARAIRHIAPNVVHSHSGVWYKTAYAARLAGVRRVLHTEHGMPFRDTWLARTVERLAARQTDVVVAVSDALAAHLRATVAGGARVDVIPNGVDTDLFRPAPDAGTLRRELGLAAEVPLLGSIGRLEAVKAYDVMVDALAQLRAAWPAGGGPLPVLAIAGGGAEADPLRARAVALGLGDAIHWLGWRDDLHDLHHAFTLFTLSSHSEGTSVSLLEAMSAGLCPVVTDVGGNRAVLGEALAHRLVPAGDPAALAAAWHAALTDQGRRRADAAAARGRVESVFSLDAMVRRYEALYAGSAP